MTQQTESSLKRFIHDFGSILALFSFILSLYAAVVARSARDDTRAIAGLNLKPKLEVSASFAQAEGDKSVIYVTNSGPVRAEQLEIQFISCFYDASKDRFSTVSGSDETFTAKTLEPQSVLTIPLSDHWVNVNAKINKPVDHNVMEMQLSFRRPPDMELSKMSAFYFVAPDGRWVSETNSVLDPVIYGIIKEKVMKRNRQLDGYRFSDPLHSVRED